MKLTNQFALIAKAIQTQSYVVPLICNWTHLAILGQTVYSDLLLISELSHNIVREYYNVLEDKYKPKPEDVEALKLSIYDLITYSDETRENDSLWKEIFLEDINTYDATWWVAWIKDSNYWIDTKTLNATIKLLANKSYKLFLYNNRLAFTNITNVPFIIVPLLAMQQSLI